jgi:hypothetical protein
MESPEYMQIGFQRLEGAVVGHFYGSLDDARPSADRVALIEDFLDALRPGRGDNRPLAETLERHSVALRFETPLPTPEGHYEPPPPDPTIPGPFVIAESLDANLSAATWRDGFRSSTFTAGPWKWEVMREVASNTTYPAGAKWYVDVDAGDWVSVQAITAADLNEWGFVDQAQGILRERNVNATVDPAEWSLYAEGWGTGYFCSPEEMDAIRESQGDR